MKNNDLPEFLNNITNDVIKDVVHEYKYEDGYREGVKDCLVFICKLALTYSSKDFSHVVMLHHYEIQDHLNKIFKRLKHYQINYYYGYQDALRYLIEKPRLDEALHMIFDV